MIEESCLKSTLPKIQKKVYITPINQQCRYTPSLNGLNILGKSSNIKRNVMPSKKLKDTKPYNILFPHKTITDWDHLVKFYNQKREEWSGWIFRGHRDSEWSLTTTIERLAIEQWSRTYDELPTIEAGLIRSFRRHFLRFFLLLEKLLRFKNLII